jgi:hypothetical protein
MDQLWENSGYWARMEMTGGDFQFWSTLLHLGVYGSCLVVAVLAYRAFKVSRAEMGSSVRADPQRFAALVAVVLALGITALHVSRGC